MTKVLVVHRDPDMADQEADWLRRDGFTVIQCSGPTYAPCPILSGEECPAVDDADVLVYDVWASGDSEFEKALIERIRESHPGTPIVLTAPGLEFDWVETAGAHAVIPLEGALTAARLRTAVEEALVSAGKAYAAS
jgi:DNA-binding NtrC family response regulator